MPETGEQTPKPERPRLVPNSPQQKFVIHKMKVILDEVIDEDDGINTYDLALDLWAATRSEKRPVKDDSWRT